MVVTCDIDFDNNPYGTYFAGQVVTGRITLKLDKPKQVKGVSLKIYGYADTSWTESNSTTVNNKDSSSTTYRGHEDYLASITYLLGSNSSASNATIEPGMHTYQFACQLPINCPSSFEGFSGHIRYMVVVALERPWKFDQTFTRCFTVLKVMDLNYESPILKMPAHTEVEKIFCFWPCHTNPLQLKVSLPQTGFVPGQVIPIGVLVSNDSRIPVESMKITLAMIACLYSQGVHVRTKQERIVVAKMSGDPVPRYCKKQFVYEMAVPATPPTCFTLCKIIQIAYQIEVEAKVKGFHMNSMAHIPITIGSVPFVPWNSDPVPIVQQQPMMAMSMPESESEFVPALPAASDPRSNGTMSQFTPPWADDSNISPPSYETAVHMPHAQLKCDKSNDNKSEEYGQVDFAPLYPVYSIPSPTPCDIAQEEQNRGIWL